MKRIMSDVEEDVRIFAEKILTGSKYKLRIHYVSERNLEPMKKALGIDRDTGDDRA